VEQHGKLNKSRSSAKPITDELYTHPAREPQPVGPSRLLVALVQWAELERKPLQKRRQRTGLTAFTCAHGRYPERSDMLLTRFRQFDAKDC
jgi:hypothetical protein